MNYINHTKLLCVKEEDNPYLEEIRATTKHHFESLNDKLGKNGILEVLSKTVDVRKSDIQPKPSFNYKAFSKDLRGELYGISNVVNRKIADPNWHQK